MLDPIGAYNDILDLYLSYLDTVYRLRRDDLSKERQNLLRQPGNLMPEPFIEPILRYQPAKIRLEECLEDQEDNPLSKFKRAERRAIIEMIFSGLFQGNLLMVSCHEKGFLFHILTKLKCFSMVLLQENQGLLLQELAQVKLNLSYFQFWQRLQQKRHDGLLHLPII